jgi:CpeT protein
MIEKFCEYFNGYFNNQKQAYSYPSKFALIELYHEKLDNYKFRVKQKYSISDTPYRESIIKIIENDNFLLLKNYKNDGETELNGCDVLVFEKEGEFLGKNISNQCIIKNQGRDTYLVTESILGEGYYKVVDKGYDLYTNDQVWGSYNGFFCFNKLSS